MHAVLRPSELVYLVFFLQLTHNQMSELIGNPYVLILMGFNFKAFNNWDILKLPYHIALR